VGEKRRREMKARRGSDRAVVAEDMVIASEGEI
jgi:hypothetical protein